MNAILSVRNLSTGYGKKQVLFDVCMDVMPGEIMLITGGNGSGKSTLLKAIYGVLPSWNGGSAIQFRPDPNTPPLATSPASENLSKGIAYVPQKQAVFDSLTVEDNLRLAGHTLRSHAEFLARREEVLASIPALGLLLRRKPERMSGGERQVVALAMVLLHRPRLMLLDEPTAGLDPLNSEIVLNALLTLHHVHAFALVAIEHRRHECAALRGRLCRMQLGRLESTTEICENRVCK